MQAKLSRAGLVLALALFSLPASAAPLLLEFEFDEGNSPAGSPIFVVGAGAQFPGGSSSGSSAELTIAEWSLPLVTVIADNRQSAVTGPTTFTMTGPPQSVSGAFDLGFSGSVPYTVTLESVSIGFTGMSFNLAPNGSFLSGSQLSVSLGGTAEILGSEIPFLLTSVQNVSVRGKFTPSGDVAELSLEIDGNLNTQTFFTTSFSGIDLRLAAGVEFDRNEYQDLGVVPEPATATLLALGLAALAARRRA
jgi:hypothetical protein